MKVDQSMQHLHQSKYSPSVMDKRKNSIDQDMYASEKPFQTGRIDQSKINLQNNANIQQ